jgi:hypothetical protein
MHARARNHWGISSGELIRDKRKRPSGELRRRTGYRGERHFATGATRRPTQPGHRGHSEQTRELRCTNCRGSLARFDQWKILRRTWPSIPVKAIKQATGDEGICYSAHIWTRSKMWRRAGWSLASSFFQGCRYAAAYDVTATLCGPDRPRRRNFLMISMRACARRQSRFATSYDRRFLLLLRGSVTTSGGSL